MATADREAIQLAVLSTRAKRGPANLSVFTLDMQRVEGLRSSAVRGPASTETLDAILTLQLAVAWAGEGMTEPPRLGWWRTGMADELGGEDLFRRLTPRTWRWAVLGSARAAARKVDAEARAAAADADQLVSLFRLGFVVDEQLDDRLAELGRTDPDPTSALPGLGDVVATWNRDRFAAWLKGQGSPAIAPSSIGRRLRGEPPDDPAAAARALVAAMAPLGDQYPAPHFKTSTPGRGARG